MGVVETVERQMPVQDPAQTGVGEERGSPTDERPESAPTSRGEQVVARQVTPDVAEALGPPPPANQAPLIAPTDVPVTRSGRMSCSASATIMPTWSAPWLAPPERTNARVM